VILKNTERARSTSRFRWCPPRRLPLAPMVHWCPRTTCRARPMRPPARSASSWHHGPARSRVPSRSGQPRYRDFSERHRAVHRLADSTPEAGRFSASGVYYIRLVANQTNSVVESNYSNNVSAPVPVRFISLALPELQATALDVPDSMQPGDTIALRSRSPTWARRTRQFRARLW